MEPRLIALLCTAIAVLGSIWAMHRKLRRTVVAAFMASGLAGLAVFAYIAALG